MGAAGAGSITITDAEMVSLPKDGVIVAMNCNDANLPRLLAHGKMYERFRILSLGVDYVPLSGAATEGNVKIAITPGPKRDAITAVTIVKVQPLLLRSAWKAGSLQAGRNLDSQRFMHVAKDTEEGVAATIYAFPSAADLGVMRVRYTVQLAFPVPF